MTHPETLTKKTPATIVVMLGLVITFSLSGLSDARAAHGPAHNTQAHADEVAVLPLPVATAPLALKAACQDGVAVFSVQNKSARWQARGKISIVEVHTGRTLRQRQLTLGERQMASFRITAGDMRGDRYRVTVRLPDGRMTYVKSFTGRCLAPKTETRTTQR